MDSIVNALRCCVTNYNSTQSRLCNKCPYKEYADGRSGCENKLKADAADALKTVERTLDQNTKRCEELRKQLRESNENYEKHLDELEARLPKWVSVEDHLPEESGEYIVYIQMGTGVEVPDFFGSNDLSYATSMYFKKSQKLWFDEYDESYNADLSLVDTVNDFHVTHWMPIPSKLK